MLCSCFMEARATTATQVISPLISLSFLLRRFFFLCVGRANDAPIYYQPSAEQAKGTQQQKERKKKAKRWTSKMRQQFTFLLQRIVKANTALPPPSSPIPLPPARHPATPKNLPQESPLLLLSRIFGNVVEFNQIRSDPIQPNQSGSASPRIPRKESRKHLKTVDSSGVPEPGKASKESQKEISQKNPRKIPEKSQKNPKRILRTEKAEPRPIGSFIMNRHQGRSEEMSQNTDVKIL